MDVVDPSGIAQAFRTAAQGRADAVLMMATGRILIAHREQIAEWANKTRLPVIYERIENVEAGGLMSYGVNFADLDRRAAYYVDRALLIAKGLISREEFMEQLALEREVYQKIFNPTSQ